MNADEIGDVRIAPGVLELIIGLAASEVEGVAGLSGGVIGGISDWLKRGPTKGVKIDIEDSSIDVELHLIVDYGRNLPEVAKRVQENVKKAVESMTSCAVNAVDVHIDGLSN